MNAEQKRLAREIFADALEKDDPRERAALVAQACGTDGPHAAPNTMISC